jgi:hypothetical protein
MSLESRRGKRRALGVESLEGRVVLSTAQVTGAVVPAALVKGVSYLYLQGSGQGTFKHHEFLPADIPSTDVFKGTARLGRLGAFKVSGSLTGTGFITNGNGTGTLTLSNSRGSVTLSLTGPPLGGFHSPASGTYAFVVTGGTGAFAHSIGNGNVDVTLGSNTFALGFHGAPNRY